jgi:monoterpene epsilon-lactone hydrolase
MTAQVRPSLRLRMFGLATRYVIRRRHWGSPDEVARRARQIFGAKLIWPSLRSFGVTVTPVIGGDVRAEWVTPAAPAARTVMYVHGGGYVACTPRTHRPVTAALARKIPARVLSTHYRWAPEHPFPAALDDTERAYRALLETGVDPRSLALAGDSAGGGLVLALLLRIRAAALPMPACVVVLSPWTDLAGTGASVRLNDGRCDMFTPETIEEFARCYAPPERWREPEVSPLYADDLGGLPPMQIQVGEPELLRDDSVRLHERIRAAGGTSELLVHDGAFHGFHMLDGLLPEAGRALNAASRFIATHSETR